MSTTPSGAGRFALVLGLSVLGCRSDDARPERNVGHQGTSRAAILQPCAVATVDLSSWQRIDAGRAPISLVLPPGAVLVPTAAQEEGRGETWRAGDLTVLYRLRPRTQERDDLEQSPNWQDHVVCGDSLTGRAARVLRYYSEAAILPGQFVFATWSIAPDRELTVHVQSRRRASVDTLLAIVQAVRFR